VINIRPALPSEADLVQRISAAAYIPAYAAVIGTAPKPAFEDYRARIARKEAWLLEDARLPVAILILERHPDHLLVYSVAVLPDHQGRGHARALLAFAETEAASTGVPELRLYTNRRMTANLELYRRCGFRDTGARPHPSRPGEVLVDMTKRIGKAE